MVWVARTETSIVIGVVHQDFLTNKHHAARNDCRTWHPDARKNPIARCQRRTRLHIPLSAQWAGMYCVPHPLRHHPGPTINEGSGNSYRQCILVIRCAARCNAGLHNVMVVVSGVWLAADILWRSSCVVVGPGSTIVWGMWAMVLVSRAGHCPRPSGVVVVAEGTADVKGVACVVCGHWARFWTRT